MTNAQKWVAVFLFLFIVLFVIQSLTKKDEAIDEDIEFYGDSAEQEELTGTRLYSNNGCASCHGTDLKGTTSGPSLTFAKEYWKRTELINYLRNPNSYGDKERIMNYKSKFGRVTMPAYENVDVKDLGKIADYILSAQ